MPEGELPDTRLGKYRLLRKIGRGGMGVVYEAEDTLLERRVALKVLPRKHTANAKAIARFRREAIAASRLTHPNIVALYDINQHDGVYFIAMELMPGGSTEDHIREQGPFPWPEASRLIAEACRGLGAAHDAGILHRDVKPPNLLLGAGGHCKLADFGLAKAVGQGQTVTAEGAVLGTANYMSPEQCRSEPLDARSDLYSLGATYFTLLTGAPPFRGEGPMETMFAQCSSPVPDAAGINADIDRRCARVIDRAMAKEPDERYPDAAAMLADLDALTHEKTSVGITGDRPDPLDGSPDFGGMLDTEVISDPDPKSVPGPSRRLWIGVAVGMILVGGTVALIASLGGGDPDDLPEPIAGRIGEEAVTVPLGAAVTGAAISPDGELLCAATAGGPGGVRVWSAPSGEPVAWPWKGRAIRRVAATNEAVFASGDNQVLRWDRDSGDTEEWEMPDTVGGLAVSPDGGQVAVCCGPTLCELSAKGGSTRWVTESPPGEDWLWAAYSTSPTLLAAATPGSVHVWRPNGTGWSEFQTLPVGPEPTTSLCFAPDNGAGGRTVLGISTRGYLRDWLLERDGSAFRMRFDGEANRGPAPIWTMALADDGIHVAWADPMDGITMFRRVGAGTGQGYLTGHRAPVRVLTFAPKSRMLVSGSDDGTLRIWPVTQPDGRPSDE